MNEVVANGVGGSVMTVERRVCVSLVMEFEWLLVFVFGFSVMKLDSFET